MHNIKTNQLEVFLRNQIRFKNFQPILNLKHHLWFLTTYYYSITSTFIYQNNNNINVIYMK